MKKGILGKKLGMTQVFTKTGRMIPVTVVAVEPNVVTQIKTTETDGYDAIQLGFDTKREKLANKPEKGHVQKAKTAPKRFFREIRNVDISQYTIGQLITAEVFSPGEVVDVTGTSKGKGFQGAIKRHNYSRGPMSHGSHHHRGPGSLGTMEPKRVFKGKKLPGHMGVQKVTIQNLEVIMVDTDNNIILIKGNIPGPNKSLVVIRTATKNPGKINDFPGLNIYEQEIDIEKIKKDAATEEDVQTEEVEQTAEEKVEQTVETTEEEKSEETVEEQKEEITEEENKTSEETKEEPEEEKQEGKDE